MTRTVRLPRQGKDVAHSEKDDPEIRMGPRAALRDVGSLCPELAYLLLSCRRLSEEVVRVDDKVYITKTGD